MMLRKTVVQGAQHNGLQRKGWGQTLLGVGLPLLLALGSTEIRAGLQGDRQVPMGAAVVGDITLPAATVALIHAHQRDAQPGTRYGQTLRELIDQELLARPLRAKGVEQAIEHSSVGYRPVELVRQITTLVLLHRDQGRMAADPALQQQMQRCLHAAVEPQPGRLQRVLPQTSVPLLQESLSPTERVAAEQWKVIDCQPRLPSAEIVPPLQISLAELYQDTNLQNQMLLRHGDMTALEYLRRQRLQQELVRLWASQPAELGAAGVAALVRAIENQLMVQQWKQDQGLAEHVHGTAEGLQALARQVTPAQIQAYYRAHPEQFQRVAHARARHIVLHSEAMAQQLRHQLDQGGDFASLARQHSQAPDAAVGGDLGERTHRPDQADWLDSMIFVLPVGQISRPIRHPAEAGQPERWELIEVQSRQHEAQPMDSAAVRFEASQAIARQQAAAQYRLQLEHGWQTTEIRIHPQQVLEPAP